MTLVSDIIRDAYRESNLIAINADPTSDEQTEGLRLLNRIISSTYGSEVGEKYREVIVGRNNISKPSGYPWYDNAPPVTDWTVPTNVRLILNMTESQTVYLNPSPEDGDRFAVIDKSGNLSTYPLTVQGNGRTIGNATSVAFSTDSDNKEYVYRADTGNWALVSPLLAEDAFPFPSEFEDLFVILLAMRINPRNGAQIAQQSLMRQTELMRKFKARYRSTEEVGSEDGITRLSSNKNRGNFDTRRSNAKFNSGRDIR